MLNDQSKNLSELITETLELRNLDVKKLSELTDIPVHYLTALTNGELSKLPAIPYIRGYLIKIAETLRIDADVLLRVYKREISLRPLKTSGPEDKLPSNRYALKPLHKKTAIIAGIILVMIIAYSIWQIDDFLGTPQIEIISPAADSLIVNNPSIKLLGRVNPRDKLTINNEEILAGESGQFEKEIPLQPGINTIEFKVKRFLGKEVEIIRQVIYQP
jgi:cytoskeletal protein RodZ